MAPHDDTAQAAGEPDFGRAEKLLDSARKVHTTIVIACAAVIGLYWPTTPPLGTHCAAVSGIQAVQGALELINGAIEPDENVKWVCVVDAHGDITDIWQDDGQSHKWIHSSIATAPVEVVVADLQDSTYIGVSNHFFDREQELGQAQFRPQMEAMLTTIEQPLDDDQLTEVMQRSLTARAICSSANRVTIEFGLDIHEACAQVEQRSPGSQHACLERLGAPGADQYLVVHDRRFDSHTIVSRSLEDQVADGRRPELRTHVESARSLAASPVYEVARGRATATGLLAVQHDWLEKFRASLKRENVTIASIPAPELTVVSLLLLALLGYLSVTLRETRRLVRRHAELAGRHFEGYQWIGTFRNYVARLLTALSVVLLPFIAVCVGRLGDHFADEVQSLGALPSRYSWKVLCADPNKPWLNEMAGWGADLRWWDLLSLAVGLLVFVQLRRLWTVPGRGWLCRAAARVGVLALRLLGLEVKWREFEERWCSRGQSRQRASSGGVSSGETEPAAGPGTALAVPLAEPTAPSPQPRADDDLAK
ncbi:hypothetical protein [Enhygromyxa salina]|uniref:Uncharacterized protein n=1 Tax=Enhygromyxa salina TaxID=215803 RepID=A0A2S9YR57_9BACT|nr:hypothetical protein [Enhygromyxa salina]PRQ07566.1 hypothetical protein ENSA7_25560 [Enhygromyxa salina]